MTVKLGDLSTVRTGLVVARKKARLDSPEKIEYKQISLRCFDNGVKLDKSKNDIFTSAEKIDTKYLTQIGDVVVRLRAPSSAVYIEKEDEGLLIHSLLAVIRVDSKLLNAKYLAYYINSHNAQRILKQDVKGTAIPMLKTKDLEELKIALPPLEKQNKLVQFLELADKERGLLMELAHEKKKLSQVILNNIIKEEN